MENSVVGIITLISTAVAIIASVFSVYISLKKHKPEIKNTDSLTEKNKAEIVEIYADEIRKTKEDQEREQEKRDKKIEILEQKIVDLNNKLIQQTEERRAEQVIYREFINELLFGIMRLSGQIELTGVSPVWSPPVKTPFGHD